jgi:hypothetical protein
MFFMAAPRAFHPWMMDPSFMHAYPLRRSSPPSPAAIKYRWIEQTASIAVPVASPEKHTPHPKVLIRF